MLDVEISATGEDILVFWIEYRLDSVFEDELPKPYLDPFLAMVRLRPRDM